MIVSPKKLAILLPSLHGGGAERVMLAVAGGVVSRGHSVDLVLTKAQGPYLAEVSESVRLVDLKASRVLFSLPSLIRYLRSERPDSLLSVLHANMIAPLARRLAGVQTRVILSMQNTLSVQTRYATDLRVRLEPRFVRLFRRWTDGIVAVSAGVADDLSQTTGIPRQLIQVIYNPIITPEVIAKSQAPLEHPWFRVGEPPVILAVGRLTDQKDFPTLIRAFALIRKNHHARLIILGEGEERSAIEALVKQLGLERDVSLPGFIVNPYPYMVRSSVFVLSSKWEGLPTVLVEALYCGAAVVSTDCPSGPREILRGGQYGQIVPVGDLAKIALSVENALAGRGPHPPQDWWKPYGLEAVVDRYIKVLFPGQTLS
jgi:glycosyltransferase involved in cell wall biosynthesis